MAQLDYFEYKITKHNGEVFYSDATQHALPPLIDTYKTVEELRHHTNGAMTTELLRENECKHENVNDNLEDSCADCGLEAEE